MPDEHEGCSCDCNGPQGEPGPSGEPIPEPRKVPISELGARWAMAAASGMTMRGFYHQLRREKGYGKRKPTKGAFGKQD